MRFTRFTSVQLNMQCGFIALRRFSLLALMWLVMLAPVVHGQDDAELPIVKGFGPTTWGQPLADIQAIWPGGAVQAYRETYTSYEVAGDGDGPVTKTMLSFFDDQLHRIIVVFELPDRPEKGIDEDGLVLVKDLIKEKYHPTEAAKRQLRSLNRIMVEVRPRPDGSIHVSYENVKIVDAARQAMKERKAQEVAERRAKGGPRNTKLKELGLGEML